MFVSVLNDRRLVALALVAVGYVVAQLVAIPPVLPLGPDESLYYSQFAPGVPSGYMGAPRAWGTPLLSAPITFLTDSTIALRLYLALLSGAGLFLAFFAWWKVHATAAVPLAAFLFGSLWVSLFYGAALMPNMAVALSTLAAVGLFVQAVRSPGSWRPLAGLAIAFSVMSLVRPTEALPVVAALLLASLAWRHLPTVLAILAGTTIGWTVWAIEAQVRFGGLLRRLHENDLINDTGWTFSGGRHLEAFSSAFLLCQANVPSCGDVTASAVVYMVGLGLLTGLGLWVSNRETALAVGVAACSAFPYLFYTSLANPRFFLPAYALTSLAAAHGIIWLAVRHRYALFGVTAVLVLMASNQYALAHEVGSMNKKSRAKHLVLARKLKELGVEGPCLVNGRVAWHLAVLLHCRSIGDHDLRKVRPTPSELRELHIAEAAQGVRVAYIAGTPEHAAVPAGWNARLLTRRPLRYAFLSP